jgi:solute carrier family 35, member C2
MEPITGHRRRKSSLMNPVGHNGAPTFTRPRAPSLLNPVTQGSSSAAGPAEQAKLSSEGSYNGSVSPSAVSPRDNNNSDYENFSDEDIRDDEETGLTSKEKKKREKKRRRNTRLDQRIAREKNLSADEKRELDKGIAKRIAINLVLVLMWYLLSLAISLVRGLRFLPSPSNCPIFKPANGFVNNSTTNGCSIKTVSTLLSLCSQRPCT